MKKEIKFASICGGVLGKKIFLVVRDNIDLNYNKKKLEGVLTTSRPIYKYSIESKEVKKVAIGENANHTKIVVFNDDRELSIPLANINDITDIIPKPTAESVKVAIEKMENTGERTIFFNRDLLSKEVCALNNEAIKTLNQFANEIMQFSSMVSDINSATESATKQILKDEQENA